jgi:hypothetical protein
MRKKSENRSSIIRPLHFGHSIESSLVVTCTAVGGIKQDLNQIVAIRNFNMLEATYLSEGGSGDPDR